MSAESRKIASEMVLNELGYNMEQSIDVIEKALDERFEEGKAFQKSLDIALVKPQVQEIYELAIRKAASVANSLFMQEMKADRAEVAETIRERILALIDNRDDAVIQTEPAA